ncbi:hypothetical protein BEP19_02895 [Ammoniphilus oxalaticus]|uniref:Gram-positive cocci surface proteins LPxTG domain-containing protein n=1 Tax=Ammoniphilus oxalaticus TaxID=66863 RepID=A0A419SNS5_9BACL|nr:SpaA isopeptide-forming pilin-related protein [Ammoniphilus oxalaticus]RKD25892.1 hypothetical protein BEP19_02895 [Ammoniphilus oxalaticus]
MVRRIAQLSLLFALLFQTFFGGMGVQPLVVAQESWTEEAVEDSVIDESDENGEVDGPVEQDQNTGEEESESNVEEVAKGTPEDGDNLEDGESEEDVALEPENEGNNSEPVSDGENRGDEKGNESDTDTDKTEKQDADSKDQVDGEKPSAENPDEQQEEEKTGLFWGLFGGVFGGNSIVEFPFITNISIKDKDGKDLDQAESVSKSEQVILRYDWQLPNDHEIQEGATYKFALPEGIFAIMNTISLSLDSDGDQVANVKIDTDGNGVITFTEFVGSHSNVEGWFEITTKFNPNEIPNQNPVEIKFEVDGKSEPIVVKVNFEQPEPTIKKTGKYNAQTNTITWVVDFNKEKVSLQNAVFSDALVDGLEYVNGSFKVSPDPRGNFSEDNGTLTYEFPAKILDSYAITFDTKVTDFEGTSLIKKNTATIKYNEDKEIESSTTVTANANYIKKSGKDNYANKQIDWEIIVNEDELELENFTIIDQLPVELELVMDSVKLNDGNLTGFEYKDGEFSYQFVGAITSKQIITFSTKVPEKYYNGQHEMPEFENVAKIFIPSIGKTISSNKVGIGPKTSVIRKTGAGYNRSTQEITWKITVNENEVEITNAVLTDQIPKGQEFVKGSFEINSNPGGIFSQEGQTLTFTFPDKIEKTYIITFKTKVINPAHTAANKSKSYENSVTLTGANITESTSTGKQTVTSKVIKKTNEGYDYLDRVLTWKIVVNQNKMELPNAVLTDVIGDGQELVEDSLVLPDGATHSYDNKKLKITLGTITEEQLIIFKTSIADPESFFKENGEKTVENTATLTNDFGPSESSTGTKKIENTVVAKGGSIVNGEPTIEWKVTINQNKLLLGKAILTDVLPEGLTLDTSSVKLYKQELDVNGNLTKGIEVNGLDASNISYDGNERKFVFTMPEVDNNNEAFLLVFRTDILDASKSPFKNTINFKGYGLNDDQGTSSNTIAYQSGSGGASGTTGSVNIIKIDAEDETKRLKDASFALYDRYGNLIREASTGNNGEVLFDRLRFEIPYTIKEVSAPTGYSLNGEVKGFILTSKNKNVEYKVKNEKITGSIKLIKIDADNNTTKLSGAIFELLDENKEVLKQSDATTSDGIVVFDKLEFNTKYIIREKTSPWGYKLSDEEYSFTLQNNDIERNVEYEFKNKQFKEGSVSIIKVDSRDKSKRLSGAEFEVRDSDGKVVATVITDADGKAEVKNLTYGDYKLVETKAPRNYQFDKTERDFTIDDNEHVIALEITNKKRPSGGGGGTPPTDPKGSLSIIKVDSRDQSNRLSGATFELKDSDGKVVATLTTDANGQAKVADLALGEYTLVETKAPEGYELGDAIRTIKIERNHKDITLDKIPNVKSTDPKDPKNPQDPDKPVDPEDPNKDPEDPINPEDPEQTDPLDPSKPVDPADPSESTDPGQSGEQGDASESDQSDAVSGGAESADTGKVDGHSQSGESGQTKSGKTKFDQDGRQLPNTATPLYNYALAGLVIVLAGFGLRQWGSRRRQH